jgi:hypothetical protein
LRQANNEHLGYEVTDNDEQEVISELRKVEHTIKLRLLY